MKKFLLLTLLIAICFTFTACKAEVNVYLDSSEESIGSDISSGDAADESSQTDTGSSDASDTASTDDGTQKDEDKKPSGSNSADDKKPTGSSQNEPTQQPSEPKVTEYTVTFNSDGGSAVAAAKTSGKVTKPADPTRAGYKFLGWYKQGSSTAWDFNQKVSGDMTLIARWEIIVYTVTFNSDGGSAVAAAKTSGKVTKPADPTRDGHRFLGWYKQGSSTDWNFDDKVTEDMTLVARWGAIVEYNVTFETGEGSAVPPSKTSGGKVIRPADPTYSGYKFSGWKKKYSDDLWDFDQTVSEDIVLEAVWAIGGDIGGFIPL